MANSPTLQIPQDVIEPIIQAEIARVITEAMGGRTRLLEAAINTVLSTKVNSSGVVDSYNSSNNRPWIEWALANCLKKATTEALEAALIPHQEMIKKKLIEELSKKNSPIIKQLCEGMMSTFCNADRLKYGITIKAE